MLLLEIDIGTLGVGFLLGIIGAGFGSVLQQVVAGNFRRSRLLRALRREIDENIARLGPLDGSALGFPNRVERRAYDAADEVDFPASLSETLTRAYVAGAELNDRINLVDGSLIASAGQRPLAASSESARAAMAHQEKTLSDSAVAAGRLARHEFEKARDELRKMAR